MRQPAVISAPPTMPEGLSPAEQACWAALMGELSSVPGLVSRADRGVCELVARLEPQMRAAAATVREHGSTLTVTDAEGRVRFTQTRPEATYALKIAAQLKALYGELGLTPSGRCRVALTPSAPASKLDSFLKQTHGA